MSNLFGNPSGRQRKRQLTFSDVVNRAIRLVFFDDNVSTHPSTTLSANQLMTNGSVVCENEKRLSLVFEDLSEFPFSLVKKYSTWIQMVDLSHNKFSDVRFLEHFDVVDAVILDHNLLSRATLFPRLPSLKTLWLNYNRIHDLTPFLNLLSAKCPNLVYLSLMGNKGTPSVLRGDSQSTINAYRIQVIGYFPKLRHLDDSPVTQHERDAAYQLHESKRLSVSKVIDTINNFMEGKIERRQMVKLPQNGVV